MNRLTVFYGAAALAAALTTNAWAAPTPSLDSSSGAQLTVALEGLRSNDGQTICRIFPEGSDFPMAGSLTRVEGRIADNRSACVFKDLAPGRYAVATAHDENGDGGVNRNLFGIPTEGFAFSRNARALFGPPSFEETAVEVGLQDARLSIRMTYL